MFSKLYNTELFADYNNAEGFNRYPSDIMAEYNQCIEEGVDVGKYKSLFESAAAMESGAEKNRISDIIFDIVMSAGVRKDYKYKEPLSLEEIRELRKKHIYGAVQPDGDVLRSKILGAWTGRAVGCLLGKPVECIRSDELIPFLKETGNYPMHRFILSSDVTDEVASHYKFNLKNKIYGDTADGMPIDDDTNYTVLYQMLIERYGRDFTTDDVGRLWISSQPVTAYFTAERIAVENLMNCLKPPATAIYKNICREWIGAGIRGDYFGYINPGAPEKAAEMAYRDARLSHVKNGIYGEMLVSAMLSVAAVNDSVEDIILGGLSEIPATSRLYEAVMSVYSDYKNGVRLEDTFRNIHSLWNEHTDHGWCHIISNAMVVTAALLYGEGDFGKSICIAVGMAFDTDCNGATVGSVLGMRGGIDSIPDYWRAPLHGKIHTSITGAGTVEISVLAEKTIKHIKEA